MLELQKSGMRLRFNAGIGCPRGAGHSCDAAWAGASLFGELPNALSC